MTNIKITRKEGPTEIDGIPTCKGCIYFTMHPHALDRRICKLSYQLSDSSKNNFCLYHKVNIRDKKIDSILQ